MSAVKPSTPSFGPRKRYYSQTPPRVPPMPPKRTTKRRKLQDPNPRSSRKLFRLALPEAMRQVTMVKMEEAAGNTTVPQHVRQWHGPPISVAQPAPCHPAAACVASRYEDGNQLAGELEQEEFIIIPNDS